MFNYYSRREDIAFEMPFDTENEKEDAVKYINYNIPYEDCLRLELIAHQNAGPYEEDKRLESRIFRIYSRFYLSLIDYKIDRILEKIFDLS